AEGNVHLATLDGTLSCFRQDDGRPAWQEAANATSSPVVWQGHCHFSQRHAAPETAPGRQGTQQWEHVARPAAAVSAATRRYEKTARRADYLDHAKRQMRSPIYGASAMADGAVGFAAFKGDAKMYQAMGNLGQAHVHGVWSYQGSKPFLCGGRLYSALG